MKLNNRFGVRSTRVFFLIAFSMMAASCSSADIAQKSDSLAANTPVAQSELEIKAANLSKLYDDKNCREFIDAFPGNFRDFYALYGFDEEKGAHILYSKTEHITYFFDCSDVAGNEKLKKAIDIGIGGKWDADATAMFQASSFDLVKKFPNETAAKLDNLPDEKAASFWYFLFDGPHPTDTEKVKKFESLKDSLGKDSKQEQLLEQQYEKLKTDWKNH